MKQATALFFTGLLLIGLIPSATSQAGPSFSMSFEHNQLNLDVTSGANGTACTNLTISNDGQVDIVVDGNTTGGNLVISPNNFSVNVNTGESTSITMCVTAAIGSIHRTVQVKTIASGKDQDGNSAGNKEADITTVVDKYAGVSVSTESQYLEVCELSGNEIFSFTVNNNGNYYDTVSVSVPNAEDLESAGFTVTLNLVMLQIDSFFGQSVEATISTPVFDASSNNNYTITFQARTTLEGETISDNATVIYHILDCVSEEDEGVPSISFISSILAIAVISLRRKH